MRFSKETLDATLNTLTIPTAMTLIGLAGNTAELETLVTRLARNFNTTVSPATQSIIKEACRRWNAVPRNRMVSYQH